MFAGRLLPGLAAPERKRRVASCLKRWSQVASAARVSTERDPLLTIELRGGNGGQARAPPTTKAPHG
jgi:hypothetical protein